MATAADPHKDPSPALSIDQARRNLTEVVNRAAYGGERTVIARKGKPLAAIVSLADLQQLTQSAA